jgi:hypothetical protein
MSNTIIQSIHTHIKHDARTRICAVACGGGGGGGTHHCHDTSAQRWSRAKTQCCDTATTATAAAAASPGYRRARTRCECVAPSSVKAKAKTKTKTKRKAKGGGGGGSFRRVLVRAIWRRWRAVARHRLLRRRARAERAETRSSAWRTRRCGEARSRPRRCACPTRIARSASARSAASSTSSTRRSPRRSRPSARACSARRRWPSSTFPPQP